MLDVVYKRKAQAVQSVILRLEAGENVPAYDISRALNNKLANELGGYP